MLKSTTAKLQSGWRTFKSSAQDMTTLLKMAELRHLQDQVRTTQSGNIASRGYKVYSQNDEDGLVDEIFRSVSGGTFLEIGVQDGTECNTHLLLLKGWRGAWIEADAAMCDRIRRDLGGDTFPGRFRLIDDFVTPGNITAHYDAVRAFLDVPDIAFFSLDIDSIDLLVLRSLIGSGARPHVLCVEYNGKFPPPIVLSAEHQGDAGWTGDDYMGATLQGFADLLLANGYVLVTCSVFGINAFFVRADLWAGRPHFRPEEVWQPLRFWLAPLPGSHSATLKFARDLLHGSLRPEERVEQTTAKLN